MKRAILSVLGWGLYGASLYTLGTMIYEHGKKVGHLEERNELFDLAVEPNEEES